MPTESALCRLMCFSTDVDCVNNRISLSPLGARIKTLESMYFVEIKSFLIYQCPPVIVRWNSLDPLRFSLAILIRYMHLYLRPGAF